MEDTKEYHVRYLRAINNPIRRRILRTLKEVDMPIDLIASKMGLDVRTTEWHMDMLEHGFCVEKIERGGFTVYTLTQEGKVVNYVDK
jgi:DNA-binding transcriptional ArsR family regulator